MLKVLHTADVHLGFSMFSRTTRRGRNARSVDIERVWFQLVQESIRYQPDVFLVAGDLFHRPHPGMEAIHAARTAISTYLRSCPHSIVFLVGGNHDTPRARVDTHPLELLSELDSRVIVAAAQPFSTRLRIRQRIIQLAALPSTLPQTYTEWSQSHPSQRVVEPDPGADYRLLAIHGVHEQVFPYYGGSSLWLVPSSCYASPLWDYVAWGDYHQHVVLGPRERYSGALEYCSSNVWSESADKGALLVTLRSQRPPQIRRVTTTPRPHYQIIIQSLDDVERELESFPHLERSVVRIVFRTDRSLHEIQSVLQHLRNEWSRRVWHLQIALQRIRPAAPPRPLSSPLSLAQRWEQFVRAQWTTQPLEGISMDDILRRGMQALQCPSEGLAETESGQIGEAPTQ